jgi:hypothetical protein
MLRRRINPHESSIYRLHPELLPLIACHLATDDLIKMTHVSYHWRTVLLSHPSLWSTLDFAHAGRAFTFLTRSKSATIHVFLQRIPPNTAPPLELLKQSAERITTLGVGDYASQKELLVRTMPSLKTLQFHASYLNETVRLSFPALEALFVESIANLLSLSAPHLTRLQLSAWTIYNVEPMDPLLDFLRSCPLLEELEIGHFVDFYTERNHDAIHLPHLRAYTQHTSPDLHISLYNMLSHPSSCSVNFSCGDLFHDMDALPPFRNPTFLVEVRSVKLETRSVDYQDHVEAVVELVDAADRRVCLTHRAVLGNVTYDEVLMDVINPLYLGFLKDLDASFIETLCIEGLALWFHGGHDRVEEALGHLKNLRRLILSDSEVEPYLEALVPATATDANRWRCLKLDTLVIYSRYGDFGEGILGTLRRVAGRREVAGIPFRKASVFLLEVGNPKGSRWLDGLEELKRCIGTFELVMGDDTLDWNADDYFLTGNVNM